MKGKITFVLPKYVDLLTFAEIQISSRQKVNRMLPLRCFREQVCYRSFPHIHKAAWISGNCEGLTLPTISNRPLVTFGLCEDHSRDILNLVRNCSLRFSVTFVYFSSCWNGDLRGIKSGVGGGEGSQHTLNQVYLSYELPDSRLNRGNMLGKDGGKCAIYFLTMKRKWGGGRFLKNRYYHQFI